MEPVIKPLTTKAAEEAIQDFWFGFARGDATNLFLCRHRWNQSDVWASPDHWRKVAEKCVLQGQNLVSAYEILLHLGDEKHLDGAQRVVVDWESSGGFDAYYFYNLLAHFPSGHPTKDKYLGESSFYDIFEFELYANSAREALIAANDMQFMEKIGRELDSRLSGSAISDADIEESLYLFYDLGANAKDFISKGLFQRLKSWFLRGWENDCRYQSGARDIERGTGRTLWVANTIGYYSWLFGWQDVLEELSQSPLYWDLVFSQEFGDDHENLNLLAWSSHHANQVLLERATEVLQRSDQRIDGAISIVRLDSVVESI